MSEPKRGEVWIGPAGGTVKVMAVVDGYVMYRFKGAMPTLCIMREWLQIFHREADRNV